MHGLQGRSSIIDHRRTIACVSSAALFHIMAVCALSSCTDPGRCRCRTAAGKVWQFQIKLCACTTFLHSHLNLHRDHSWPQP